MLCFKKREPRKRKIAHYCSTGPAEAEAEFQTEGFPTNYIRTTKYTFWSFLPIALLFELSKISNLYFIAMAIINLVPAIKIFSTASSVFPIVLILFISLTKQLIETVAGYFRDKYENQKRCQVLTAGNAVQEKQFGELVVGDVVVLAEGEYIPADCVLLATSSAEGVCYMETSSLDGEKNLKVRQAVKETFAAATFDDQSGRWAFQSSFVLTCDVPEQNLNRFVGHANFFENGVPGPHSTDLTIKNFLYKGSSVRIVRSSLALVVYTGQETKIQLNLQRPRTKSSLLENLINRKVLYLAFIQVLISVVLVVYKAATPDRAFETSVLGQQSFPLYVTFFMSVILMSNLVPISLFVNIEIIRLIQSIFMRMSNELTSVSHKWKVRDGKATRETTRINCEVNNFTLADELGRVEYVLSDKTGTLTKNRLTLEAIWAGGQVYGGDLSRDASGVAKFEKPESHLTAEERELLQKEMGRQCKFTFYDKQLLLNLDNDNFDSHLKEHYVLRCDPSDPTVNRSVVHENVSVFSRRDRHPSDTRNSDEIELTEMPEVKRMPDLWSAVKQSPRTVELAANDHNESARSGVREPLPPGVLRQYSMRSQVLREMVRSLAMCHSCMLQRSGKGEGKVKYSGTSPDEVAILKGVQCVGYEFGGDLAGKRKFSSFTDGSYEYRKVLDMEFTSERAMQSIVFYDEVSRLYFMYCKGSDTKIMSVCNDSVPGYKEEAARAAEDFSRLGYRTLFYGFRYFSEEQWRRVFAEYEAARSQKDAPEALREFCSSHLETDVSFLGFIVIQDELQGQVPECVEKLRNAEIKVWVVTGDKFETALTISKSANIVSEKEEIVRLKRANEMDNLKEFFEEVQRTNGREYSLVVDMSAFNMKYFDEYKDLKRVFMKAKGVVCARSSPLVKGQLVRLLKGEGKCVLGIGDGENDVNMISEANIGVGVFGKEGTQATKVSDFAIGEFKILWKLVLFYGRVNYMRTSNYVVLYLFKNIVVVGIQFMFGFFSLASGSSFLDSWFLSIYNSFLNTFPHFYMGVFDVDIHYIKKAKGRPGRVATASPANLLDGPHEELEDEAAPGNSRTNFYIKRIIMENYWILYHESQLNRYFAEWLFWANVVYAFLLSTVIVIFSYFQIAFENPGTKSLGFGEFSVAVSLLLVVTVDISYILRAKCADVGLLLTILFLTIIPTIAYTVIYDRIAGSLVYDCLKTLFSNGQFYLIFVILVTFYVVCELLFHVVLDEVNQPFYYKLLAMENSKALSTRLINLKKMVKKRRSQMASVKLPSGQSFHNWFSQRKNSLRLKRKASFL